jgi:hypothetical protein
VNPITHFLVGWTLANVDPSLTRRERALITIAGIVPDADGLGLIAEVLTRNSARPLSWWSEYHHLLGHNLGFALLMTGTAYALARQRLKTALLVTVSFHLHLLGDLIGARGSDGEQWPIPYLLPFSNAWQLTWTNQWELNAWPNFLLTAATLAMSCHWAWSRGYSPLEMFSRKADERFVAALRHRFPRS